MSQHPRCSKVPAREERRAHRPRRDWGMSSTSLSFRAARAGAAVVAVLLGSATLMLPREAPEAPDAGVELALAEPEEGGMTDASMGDEWASLPIPPKPGPNQETRCDPKRDEVSISGGCYLRLERKPPCAEGQYVHEGRCYVAVGKRERPATTLQE